jgi:hypothetical protein
MMKTTVVFVHGFNGGEDTWGDFATLLASDPALKDYQFFFWQYPTKLNPLYLVTKYIWTDDPDISTIGQALRTYLEVKASDADRLMLIGHSMGGLAIQTFIVEEVGRQSHQYLDRLTEVILCGTPSGGLTTAGIGAFLKNQIADMDAHGLFVQKLRTSWTLLVDDARSDPTRLARFRLTPIAGLKDKFVPQETSVGPFPLDEKLFVPGDHVSMVKPKTRSDEIYLIIAQRLRSSMPTVADQNFVAAREAGLMSRVTAARDLSDTEALLQLAGELPSDNSLTRVERELGLALLGAQQFGPSVRLLQRYLASPEHKSRAVVDVEAVQQLSIALSGAGDIVGAVAELKKLPADMQTDPETQGIMAGRFKRYWLKSPQTARLGWQAFELYKSAFETARTRGDDNQTIYNGINVAYMNFVLGGNDYSLFAREVLAACARTSSPGYWTLASKAEAELLLDDVQAAEATYVQAQSKSPLPREWSATGQQALDILRRKQVPTSMITSLFANIGVA